MNSTPLRRSVALSVMLTLLAAALLGTSPNVHAAGNPRVRPPHSHPHGKTYAEWSELWWQWALSFPAAQYPPVQEGAIDCSLGQSGSVWFLAGTFGTGTTRSCTVPTGTALLIPIVNVINDYPCPDPNFKPAPGQSMEDFLTEGAQAFIDTATDLHVVVDGQPLHDLFDYRATSDLFDLLP